MGFFSGILDSVGDFIGDTAGSIGDIASAWFPEVAPFLDVLGFDPAQQTGTSGAWGGIPWKEIGDWVSSASGVAGGLAGLGPLVSGGLNYLGGASANEANERMFNTGLSWSEWQAQLSKDFNALESSRNRDWQAWQSQLDRDFQERMSSTSMQRSKADMMAAGFNPMLAFMKGGASTPAGGHGGGAQASSSPGSLPHTPTMQNALGSGVNSALSAMTTLSQTDYIDAQTKRTEAETRLTEAQIPKVRQETRTSASAEELNYAQWVRIEHEVKKLAKEVDYIASQTNLSREQTEVAKQEVINAFLRGQEIHARTGNIKADTLLKQLEVPGAQNVAEHERKYSGWAVNVRPFGRDLSAITNSAQDAASARRQYLNRKPK